MYESIGVAVKNLSFLQTTEFASALKGDEFQSMAFPLNLHRLPGSQGLVEDSKDIGPELSRFDHHGLNLRSHILAIIFRVI